MHSTAALAVDDRWTSELGSYESAPSQLRDWSIFGDTVVVSPLTTVERAHGSATWFDCSRAEVFEAPRSGLISSIRLYHDVSSAAFAEIGEPRAIDPNYDAIEARVAELRIDAADDEEPFDEASARSLLEFCHAVAARVRPAIFLMENGALRALWEDDAGSQIGIRFLSNGLLQYVLLREGRRGTLQTLGVDRDVAVRQIIDLLQLNRLWKRG